MPQDELSFTGLAGAGISRNAQGSLNPLKMHREENLWFPNTCFCPYSEEKRPSAAVLTGFVYVREEGQIFN